MKKTFIAIFAFSIYFTGNAQERRGYVGINTDQPDVTLDVNGKAEDTTRFDGIRAPRITGNLLSAKTYTSAQNGAIIYVTETPATFQGQVSKITEAGYYSFDGEVWQPFKGNDWSLTGNKTDTTHFLGTTNKADLLLKYNNSDLGQFNDAVTVLGYNAGNRLNRNYTSVFGPQSVVAFGAKSLSSLTSGNSNTGIGDLTLLNNTTGSANTAIGAATMEYNSTGSHNTAVGGLAGNGNLTGSYNVAVGNYTGFSWDGSNNTMIGAHAGDMLNNTYTKGSNNIFIGYKAGIPPTGTSSGSLTYNGIPASDYSNRINIGNVIFAKDNSSNYNSNSTLDSTALVGINTFQPTQKLDVNGNIKIRKPNNVAFLGEGSSCPDPGTNTFNPDNRGNFYGCVGTTPGLPGIWQKLNN